MVGIFTAILFTLSAQQLLRPDTASVRGTVVALGNSQPVGKAVVQLRGPGSEPLVVATGADGRFEFRNLLPGSYQLSATRSGYLDTTFGQRGPSGSGQSLMVEAGANISDIRLLMTATGAIAGRVFDDTGEPLANVPVHAFKYSYAEGEKTLTQIKADETNDLGEFRLFWLPPGQYYVSAQPRDTANGAAFLMTHENDGRFVFNGNAGRSSAQKLGEAHVPVYYPGTPTLESATRIEVRPGGDVPGIDFALSRVSTRKVSGVVIDSTTGQPAEPVNVQLVPRGDAGAGQPAFAPSNGGKFDIAGVIPGSYYLVASARLGPSDDIKILGGRTAIEVGSSDVDNLVVPLRPAIDVAGGIDVEGRPEGFSDADHPVITLQGRRDGTLPGISQIYGSIKNGRQIEFNSVIEGDYQIRWSNLPADLYVKSVRFGPADATNGTVRIDSRTTDRLQIVLGSSSGTIDGLVVDRLRNPMTAATVVLIPDVARRQRTDLYKTAASDQSGRFQLRGIPPGDYLLFAWEDIESGLWQDAEFIRRNEASGKPVRITENSRETLEAVAIPFAF